MGGCFLAGALAGYALKKVMKIAAVIVGFFIAALAYLEYHRIIQVDWNSIQTVSQSGIIMVANAVTHISNNIAADHVVVPTNIIPLASASAGLMLGLARGSTERNF